MKPTMVFDGECGFCKTWIARWRTITRDLVEYKPYQEVADRFPQIKLGDFESAVHLIEPDGQISRGARAVFKTLALAKRKRWLLWLYEKVPGVAKITESAYRFVANHRVAFSRATSLFWGDHVEPATYVYSRKIFIKALGAVYLVAFGTYWHQVMGLIGSKGIIPSQTLSDSSLHALCAAGTTLSLLLIWGRFAQPLLLVALWGIYLSLSKMGREFYSFQWDILLLEAGFLAIFLAPLELHHRKRNEKIPTAITVFLMQLLLFKLMFSSGAVKVMSGDLSWKSLAALQYHYETQPLPTPMAWYVHQLPRWFHSASTVFVFFVELAVPFLMLLPRRAKIAAFYPTVLLQVLIILTGNYAFFNYLTLALCVFLLDDAFWKKSFANVTKESRMKTALVAPVAVAVVFMSAIRLSGLFIDRFDLPTPLVRAITLLEPLRSFNSYGLFAVMTTERPEIIIEGSNNGSNWSEYEFKFKPGDPINGPKFVAPYQPRLDWQMWFAALGTFNGNYWLQNFMVRLLQGSPSVLGLLKTNPFPENPPRYIRAILYEYHFSRDKEAWWKRERLGAYSPVLSIRSEVAAIPTQQGLAALARRGF